ncbi:TerC family protein [candidate division KSB1 bacterium]|nr:TerC family protein [candidate division KSB1 bacterium]
MSESLLLIIFTICVLILLTLDLFVFHRKNKVIKIREALLWAAFWISLALSFNLLIYYLYGADKALNFLTGYLIEEALSVDNLFVFLIIFQYFGVEIKYQHKTLFWGIIGALVMRAIFIATGITLIQKFHWIVYLFGAFLVFTGFKMLGSKEKEVHPERNIILRIFTRFFPVSKDFKDGNFFRRENGRLLATPLFVVLLVVETTDVIFAMDSIPAILAITTDPFIVYTSNVCAILGLRAIYFALAGIMGLFQYLHYGLSIILMFVGVKMIIAEFIKIPVVIALTVVASILLSSILASIFFPAGKKLAERNNPRRHT